MEHRLAIAGDQGTGTIALTFSVPGILATVLVLIYGRVNWSTFAQGL